MDGSRFDLITRRFGGTATRRTALAAALAGMLPLAARAERDGRGGPEAARCVRNGATCGNGGGADGPCDTCCSRVSRPRKNGNGRKCVCRKDGQPCAIDRNCCGGMTCVAGACATPNEVAVGDACDPATDVCAGGATCRQLEADAQPLLGTGTFCALDGGETCEVPSGFVFAGCVGGLCSPTSQTEGVCGSVSQVSACTLATDSCAGTEVFTTNYTQFCAISAEGLPILIPTTGTSTNACTTAAQCDAGRVCQVIPAIGPNQNQCSFFYSPPGSVCVTGQYVCAVAGDCPTRPNLTASCIGNLCSYA